MHLIPKDIAQKIADRYFKQNEPIHNALTQDIEREMEAYAKEKCQQTYESTCKLLGVHDHKISLSPLAKNSHAT